MSTEHVAQRSARRGDRTARSTMSRILLLVLAMVLTPTHTAEAQLGGKSLKDRIKEKMPELFKPDPIPQPPIPSPAPKAPQAPKPNGPQKTPPAQITKGDAPIQGDGDRIPVVRLVGAGEEFVAILADGTAERFDRNALGRSPVGPGDDARHPRVIDVAADGDYKLVLFEDGSLSCTEGWLGGNGRRLPKKGWVPEACQDPANPVTDVAGGGSNFAAVLADGSLVVWFGRNYEGTGVQADVPSGIGTAENPVASVAIGRGHIVVLLRDGSIRCWGNNDDGQCDVPSGIGTPENPAVEVAAGRSHTVALLKDGSMACWGSNGAGQCAFPLGFSGQQVTTVAAGSSQTGAVLADGSVHLWGGTSGLVVPDDIGAGGRRVASIAFNWDGRDVAFLLNDGSVSMASAEFLSDLGRPKVGVRTVEGAVWSFADGSFFPEQRWLEAVTSPTNPAEQVFWWIDADRRESAEAVLADGSVVYKDSVSNDARNTVGWLRDYRVKRLLGHGGRRLVWCHDGSVISNNFKDKEVRTVFSPTPSLRIKAGHMYDSRDPFVLFDNGTLGFWGADRKSWGLVQVANKFPDGVGTGKFRVDSIVGTGWVALADGRLVGSLSNPPLPPTPIGSTDNRVVSAVKIPSACIAALEDGSIVIWSGGKVLYQGKPKDSGGSSVAVPKVVSLLETDYGYSHALAILEDGSVTAIRCSPGESTGECFRPCRPRHPHSGVPVRCKVFGSKYALPLQY